jgi:hypothetical protein
MRRAALGIAASIAITGCGGSTTTAATTAGVTAPSPSGRLRPPLSADELHALVRTVASVRGLPEKSPIPIERLDAEKFAAALNAREQPTQRPSSGGGGGWHTAGFLLAFNLAPPAGSSHHVSSVREVLSEQVIGFYDRLSHRVVVRTTGMLTEEGARKERGVLAHEVQHALQAQHFPIADSGALPHEDMRLAYRSVLEGDAMVSMLAYVGAENGVPLRRMLRRMQDMTRDVPVEALVRNDGHSRALMQALPITRERLTFPYYGGMSFMGDMYRAGGFPLMNLVFTRPPVSTEQVLHPSKYLADEQPVKVRAPGAPPGFQVLAMERLGELQTRVILAGCVGHAAAIRAAEGWGGDAFTVLASQDGRVALLWSTRWDTLEDAVEVEQAILGSPACWAGGGLGIAGGGSGANSLRIDGTNKVLRDGSRVVFARGLPEPLLSEAATAMLKQPDDPPSLAPAPAPMFAVPSARAIPQRSRGFVVNNTYQSPWLGLTALLPNDLFASTHEPRSELSLERKGLPLGGYLALSDRMATPAWNERTLYELGAGFARELDGERLLFVGGGETMGALGRAIERTWRVEGTPIQVRAVLIPICEDTGSLVFVEVYGDARGKQVLDYWLSTFRWMPGARPPVCEMLNPI